MFTRYEYVNVLGKYVFSVKKEKENEFIGSIPLDYEFVRVPESPLPAPFMDTLEFLSAVVAPDPKIASYISLVNSADLKNFVTYLSGEASTILTRQAQSTGATAAQTYLQQQFAQSGFTVTTQAFRTGYSSNVVATLLGKTDPSKLVLVTAHYDSRGPTLSSTTERAPGANDNGSGTGALLQITRLISQSKITFAYTVVIIAFSGEEQGLYGSAYSAQQYKNAGANIVAVLNADMIAYRTPSEAPQLAFVSRSSTLTLNTLLTNISKTYVTQLTVGTTTACCTDHSSFYNQGFPATSFFERNGAIADPQYHKSGDLVNRAGYDITLQYPLIVQAVYASLLTIAQYQS
jgi:Zn-dependent M28 family amino/carboxypeptidase